MIRYISGFTYAKKKWAKEYLKDLYQYKYMQLKVHRHVKCI